MYRGLLFRRGLCARFDRLRDRVDDGYPLPIGGNWPGMVKAGFANGLDAAVNWGNGKVFFRGAQYVRYDIATDEVDENLPPRIAGMWPGMEEIGFSNDIAAATDRFAEIRDRAKRLATFRTWRLSGSSNRFLPNACEICYPPIGASSKTH